MDNVKTVYPPYNFVIAGGIKIRRNKNLIEFKLHYSMKVSRF